MLSQVAWLPGLSMVREARRSSSCTATLADELFFENQQHSTTSMSSKEDISPTKIRSERSRNFRTEANEVCYDRGGKQLEAARPVAAQLHDV